MDASWFQIEGDTAGERIRNGLPVLVVLAVVTYVVALAIYQAIATIIDPIAAVAALILLIIWVGRRIRGWLLVSQSDADEGNESSEG